MKLHLNYPATLLRVTAALLSAAALQVAAHAEHSYEAWRAVYDESQQAGQVAKATVVDQRGNVYVTGYAGVQGSDTIYYTAKYDALDGHVIWYAKYDSQQGNSFANDIAIDSNGDIIVTGGATNIDGNLDYLTIKYSGGDGSVAWSKTYAGPQGGEDQGLKVAVDGNDDVIVTGKSYGGGTQFDFFTIKYRGTTGVTQWGGAFQGIRYNGGGNRDDIPVALAVDSTNNVIVTGSSYLTTAKTSYFTIKYTPTGASFWASPRTYNSASDAQPTAVAIDLNDNIIVTGYGRDGSDHRFFHTIAYDKAGSLQWSQDHFSLDDDFVGGAADVAVDHLGNVIVTGTMIGAAPYDKASYFTAKYLATGTIFAGLEKWHAISSSRDGTDFAKRVVVDGADNVIVTGFSADPIDHAADYYTVKYDGATGDQLWEQLYDGDGSDDVPSGLAADSSGNVVVTGTSERAFQGGNILYNRYVTIKYNRLALTTGEAAPVTTNVPAGSTIAYIGTPAIGDNGNLAAKVYVLANKKYHLGILTQGSAGGSLLPAVQGNPAVGTAGTYYSFQDPIVSSTGLLAFSGRIAGVPVVNSAGVWISDANGNLSLVLQSGKAVPGLGGPFLRSVLSISMRGSTLLAYINVTGANPTELYAYDSFFGGRALLRVGDPLSGSTIVRISALGPALASAGQARTQGNGGESVAKVTLKDGRTAIVEVNTFGSVVNVAVSGAATNAAGDTWLAFGAPGVDPSGTFFTTAAEYKPAGGVVNIGLFAGASPSTSTLFAARGATYPFSPGAKYLSFFDPIENSVGEVSYFANLYGTGVTATNHTALFFGTPSFPEPIARLGFQTHGVGGELVPAVYTGFLTHALPATGPIFMGHLGGTGINVRNNTAVWAMDENSLIRRLLRTGDSFTIDQIVKGQHVIKTVSSMALLQSLPGVWGATRSFNETGTVAVLVGFTDRTQAVLRIGIP